MPILYILYWILKAGEIPNNDYWGIIAHFYSIDGFSKNPLDWIVRANEHLVIIPSIIYTINILITKGSNLGLSLTTLSFACIQALLLAKLIPQKLKHSRLVFLFSLLCISVFTFTPVAAHNWMHGYSGVAWLGTNMFVTAAIFCLVQLVETKKLSWAIFSIAFGVISYLTYSTSLALWAIMSGVVIVMRLPLRLISLYISCNIIIYLTFFLTYKTPSSHPSLTNLSINKALSYFLTYIGAVFTTNTSTAVSLGIVGLISAASFTYYWLTLKSNSVKTPYLPWLTLQAYVILTALMTTVTRSGFGLEQAKDSRYASLPSLFWLSLIIITLLRLRQLQITQRNYKLILISFLTLMTVFIISMYNIGFASARSIASRASLQPLVTLTLHLGVHDPGLLTEAVSSVPQQFLELTSALKAHSIIPFNHNVSQDNYCTALDAKISNNLLVTKPQDSLPGFFDTLTRITPDAAKAEGWSSDNNGKLKCIAILNQDNVVRGFATRGIQRLDVVEALGSAYKFSGWKGYVQTLPTDKQLTAYAVTNNRNKWIALNNSHLVYEQEVKTN